MPHSRKFPHTWERLPVLGHPVPLLFRLSLPCPCFPRVFIHILESLHVFPFFLGQAKPWILWHCFPCLGSTTGLKLPLRLSLRDGRRPPPLMGRKGPDTHSAGCAAVGSAHETETSSRGVVHKPLLLVPEPVVIEEAKWDGPRMRPWIGVYGRRFRQQLTRMGAVVQNPPKRRLQLCRRSWHVLLDEPPLLNTQLEGCTHLITHLSGEGKMNPCQLAWPSAACSLDCPRQRDLALAHHVPM